MSKTKKSQRISKKQVQKLIQERLSSRLQSEEVLNEYALMRENREDYYSRVVLNVAEQIAGHPVDKQLLSEGPWDSLKNFFSSKEATQSGEVSGKLKQAMEDESAKMVKQMFSDFERDFKGFPNVKDQSLFDKGVMAISLMYQSVYDAAMNGQLPVPVANTIIETLKEYTEALNKDLSYVYRYFKEEEDSGIDEPLMEGESAIPRVAKLGFTKGQGRLPAWFSKNDAMDVYKDALAARVKEVGGKKLTSGEAQALNDWDGLVRRMVGDDKKLAQQLGNFETTMPNPRSMTGDVFGAGNKGEDIAAQLHKTMKKHASTHPDLFKDQKIVQQAAKFKKTFGFDLDSEKGKYFQKQFDILSNYNSSPEDTKHALGVLNKYRNDAGLGPLGPEQLPGNAAERLAELPGFDPETGGFDGEGGTPEFSGEKGGRKTGPDAEDPIGGDGPGGGDPSLDPEADLPPDQTDRFGNFSDPGPGDKPPIDPEARKDYLAQLAKSGKDKGIGDIDGISSIPKLMKAAGSYDGMVSWLYPKLGPAAASKAFMGHMALIGIPAILAAGVVGVAMKRYFGHSREGAIENLTKDMKAVDPSKALEYSPERAEEASAAAEALVAGDFEAATEMYVAAENNRVEGAVQQLQQQPAAAQKTAGALEKLIGDETAQAFMDVATGKRNMENLSPVEQDIVKAVLKNFQREATAETVAAAVETVEEIAPVAKEVEAAAAEEPAEEPKAEPADTPAEKPAPEALPTSELPPPADEEPPADDAAAAAAKKAADPAWDAARGGDAAAGGEATPKVSMSTSADRKAKAAATKPQQPVAGTTQGGMAAMAQAAGVPPKQPQAKTNPEDEEEKDMFQKAEALKKKVAEDQKINETLNRWKKLAGIIRGAR